MHSAARTESAPPSARTDRRPRPTQQAPTIRHLGVHRPTASPSHASSRSRTTDSRLDLQRQARESVSTSTAQLTATPSRRRGRPRVQARRIHEVPCRPRGPRRRSGLGGQVAPQPPARPRPGRHPAGGRGIDAGRGRVRLRGVHPRRGGRRRRFGRPGAGLRSAAGRDHPGPTGQAGGDLGGRLPGGDHRWLRALHPADDAGRGLPRAAGHAGVLGKGGCRCLCRSRRADRGRGRSGRHPADAHRCPGGDRGREAHPRGHRSVPAGCPGTVVDAGRAGHVHRRAGTGPHAGRCGEESRRLEHGGGRPR